jgi:RimJ/RimL family protein N-acetyltransferase
MGQNTLRQDQTTSQQMSTTMEQGIHLPPLFLKPTAGSPAEQSLREGESGPYFRSLDLERDFDTLFHWVNQPYAHRFWQQQGSRDELMGAYREMLQHPHAHPFVGVSEGELVCQIDIYQVAAGEWSQYVVGEEGDCGIHFLGAPPVGHRKGMNLRALRQFQSFYFSFNAAQRLYAEPDQDNSLANLLARKAGFAYIKTITLSCKTARLYVITKNDFYAPH